MISKITIIVALCSIPLILLVVPQTNIDCSGDAICLKGKITKIVDGDTIDIDDTRIRLALTSTPELDTQEGIIARDYLNKICPVGSDVLVDEDDGQPNGSYNRIVGKVICQGKILNEEILKEGLGIIDRFHCTQSEFRKESWAMNFGC